MSFPGRSKRKARAAIVPELLGYGAEQFERTLSDLAIRVGDRLMVHAYWCPHNVFTGSPIDMARAIKQAVGPKRLSVMPSLTYQDSSKAFLAALRNDEGGQEPITYEFTN